MKHLHPEGVSKCRWNYAETGFCRLISQQVLIHRPTRKLSPAEGKNRNNRTSSQNYYIPTVLHHRQKMVEKNAWLFLTVWQIHAVSWNKGKGDLLATLMVQWVGVPDELQIHSFLSNSEQTLPPPGLTILTCPLQVWRCALVTIWPSFLLDSQRPTAQPSKLLCLMVSEKQFQRSNTNYRYLLHFNKG